MKHIFLLLAFSAVFFSCSHKAEHVEKAFYYWKSNEWELTKGEDSVIKAINPEKLYVKFFEVSHDEMMDNIPIAKSQLSNYNLESLNGTIIPTVYLANDVFLKSSERELDSLVNNVDFLISKYCLERFDIIKPKEIQMDCDWTPKSRDKYFYFLQKLKVKAKTQVSCTLRLYPYKYPDKMGVPPVDKVMLMCYNLVNPLESENANSILDTDELSKYLDRKRDYPLHVDVALPIFSWMQIYQNKRFRGLLYPGNNSVKKILKQVKPLWYEVTKDTLVDNHYLRQGDLVKYEEITPEKINTAIKIIKENVVLDKTITVALYHLDEKELNNFPYETLTGFYTSFSE